MTKLDGVSQQVKQNESDFQKMWGRNDKELAILAVSGTTREAAEEANDQIYASIASQFGEGKFVSLSEFWPSEKTRAENLARWEAFWSPPRVAKFRADLEAAGKPYGFSAQAFGPFFESLRIRLRWRNQGRLWRRSGINSSRDPGISIRF